MDSQNILKKFETIEITNESRVTGGELKFCTTQQALYAKVLSQHRKAFDTLQQLKKDCEGFMQSVVADNEYHNHGYTSYHYSCEYVEISKKDFAKKHIGNIHDRFISIITTYFKEKYNVSIDKPEYVTLLEMKEPDDPDRSFYGYRGLSDEEKEKHIAQRRAYEAAQDVYLDSIINAELDYNAILDHIFVELDGSTFAERADQEIKNASRKAISWRRNKPEIKNKRIVMDILCPRKSWNDEYEVALDGEDYRAILRALAYFNSEKHQKEIYPSWHHFVGYRKLESEGIFGSHNVSSSKVLSFKYYKNGKFEVTFDAHTTAEEFASEFLYGGEVE